MKLRRILSWRSMTSSLVFPRACCAAQRKYESVFVSRISQGAFYLGRNIHVCHEFQRNCKRIDVRQTQAAGAGSSKYVAGHVLIYGQSTDAQYTRLLARGVRRVTDVRTNQNLCHIKKNQRSSGSKLKRGRPFISRAETSFQSWVT